MFNLYLHKNGYANVIKYGKLWSKLRKKLILKSLASRHKITC
jgi:hypothetical protein